MCRLQRDDVELVRAGRNRDGSWYLGRGTGRGVWWCADKDCGHQLRAGHVARALRCAVDEQEMAMLQAAVVRV